MAPSGSSTAAAQHTKVRADSAPATLHMGGHEPPEGPGGMHMGVLIAHGGQRPRGQKVARGAELTVWTMLHTLGAHPELIVHTLKMNFSCGSSSFCARACGAQVFPSLSRSFPETGLLEAPWQSPHLQPPSSPSAARRMATHFGAPSEVDSGAFSHLVRSLMRII